MNLSRLVYLSDASVRPDPAELEELVRVSHSKNESLGLSGLLLYSSGNFMQVLEGDELRISGLYSKIERDPRHKNLRRLLFKATDQRLFPNWGMNLGLNEHLIAIDQAAMDKTLLRLRLGKDDAKTAETQALSLLQEFRRQLMNQAA